RALLWLAGVALVVGALSLTDRLIWQPGLTEDNARRIKAGMTLAEVEALLGGPAADTFEMPADYPAFRWQREWREGGASVVVQFTASAWRTVPQRPRTHERAARWHLPRTPPGRVAAANRAGHRRVMPALPIPKAARGWSALRVAPGNSRPPGRCPP